MLFMKKSLQGIRKIITESNHIINLEYYLIETPIYEKDTEKLVYGIEIIKEDDSNYLESDIISKITECKNEIMRIINKLIANTVTPVGMVTAIDELF